MNDVPRESGMYIFTESGIAAKHTYSSSPRPYLFHNIEAQNIDSIVASTAKMAIATILSLPVTPKLSKRLLPSDPIIGISLLACPGSGVLFPLLPRLDTACFDEIITRTESGIMGVWQDRGARTTRRSSIVLVCGLRIIVLGLI